MRTSIAYLLPLYTVSEGHIQLQLAGTEGSTSPNWWGHGGVRSKLPIAPKPLNFYMFVGNANPCNIYNQIDLYGHYTRRYQFKGYLKLQVDL